MVFVRHLQGLDCVRQRGRHQPAQNDDNVVIGRCGDINKRCRVESVHQKNAETAIVVDCARRFAAVRHGIEILGIFQC